MYVCVGWQSAMYVLDQVVLSVVNKCSCASTCGNPGRSILFYCILWLYMYLSLCSRYCNVGNFVRLVCALKVYLMWDCHSCTCMYVCMLPLLTWFPHSPLPWFTGIMYSHIVHCVQAEVESLLETVCNDVGPMKSEVCSEWYHTINQKLV